MSLLYKQEHYDIIGACMEVHNNLGCGFLEPIYQEALSIELEERKIPFKREKKLEIIYKGKPLTKYYIADYVCYNKIIVELKEVGELCKEHTCQVLNYLNATGYQLGILVNFGAASLETKRIVL